jgi:hypothetical protein
MIKIKNNIGIALDIDETLSLTQSMLIDEIEQNFWNQENMSATDVINKYDHIKNVPYRQTDEIKNYITNRLEKSEFRESLDPVLWSIEYVRKIHQNNKIVAYISARPESILMPTKNWLEKYWFPNAEIILRPDNENRNPSERKASILLERRDIAWIVDDDKWLIEFLSEEYHWKVYSFGYENYSWCKKFVIPCKNWEFVYDKMLTM